MGRPTEELVSAFKAARRVSTPLVMIRTTDPAAAVEALRNGLKPNEEKIPILAWDILRGLAGCNKAGKAEAKRVLGDGEAAMVSGRPTDALSLAEKLGEDSIVFFQNAHRFYSDPGVVQGIWNVRDPFKPTGRMLVLLTTPGAALPSELVQDVLVLDEPLPSMEDLEAIVYGVFDDAKLEKPLKDTREKILDALVGLAAFPAEQSLAMSLGGSGVDADSLWERKRQMIEQTPGLSVWRGGETFDDIGGVQNVKKFLVALVAGIDSPRVVVFMDEIEKAFAGTGTDLSGVKTEMTGTILTYMQDREADGLIFLGPPGAAKSAVAKAMGNTAGIPTIAFDLPAMESSLVGSSTERLRTALKIVDAVSKGRMLFIATCNSISSLPPELRRRFTLGTFFFDLPTAEERARIWEIYRQKYGVEGELPQDEGWTGAEIKECCRKAYRLRMSLIDAAQYIVPVSKSAGEQIKALRQQASGKFISASVHGVYEYDESSLTLRRRAIRDLEGMSAVPTGSKSEA